MGEIHLDPKLQRLSYKLQNYHSVFYKIWQIGRIVWRNDIPTACITFDKTGNYLSFGFNEDFFNSLNDEELCFVICHECFHVILNHGCRALGLDHMKANIAEDLVINEMLFNGFGFSRDISLFKEKEENGETVGGAITHSLLEKELGYSLKRDQPFEYYYDEIVKKKGNMKKRQQVDIHVELPTDSMGDIENIMSNMSDKDKESLKKVLKLSDMEEAKKDNRVKNEAETAISKSRGEHSSLKWENINLKPKGNVKWQKFLTGACKRKKAEKLEYQWKRLNNKFACVGTDLMLPTIGDADALEERIHVALFVDVSGSCVPYVKKFCAEAKRIPKNEFDVKGYCFDTQVAEYDIYSTKVPYGGGTSFHPIEETLLKLPVYPDLVFVMTDGYGTIVSPKFPNRWHIFLTEDHRVCFPTIKNFHKLDIVPDRY